MTLLDMPPPPELKAAEEEEVVREEQSIWDNAEQEAFYEDVVRRRSDPTPTRICLKHSIITIEGARVFLS